MGFASGTISFRPFAVIGQQSPAIDQELLDKLAEHALRPRELGSPEEIEYGWSGGRHILDDRFSFEHNVFADAVHFALRVDVNKVPAELKKAYTLMEEESAAAGNPSDLLSKHQKRDVRSSVGRKIEEELRSGKFRRSKMVPILWDVPGKMLYCAASGKMLELLLEIFERTFGLALQPLSAGTLALRSLEPRGRRRDYEDSRPTRFVHSPAGESAYPEYPWVTKGPEPKDFLGNEFLLWLWHETESNDGSVKTAAGEVSVLFDRELGLDCAFGQSGKDMLRGAGPTRMPEARAALRSGKVPRRAGLVLDSQGVQYSLSFDPEGFSCVAVRLPEVEDAPTPRVLFEERITLLRDLKRTLDAVFESFLAVRASSKWERQTASIRRWIQQTGRPAAAAVA